MSRVIHFALTIFIVVLSCREAAADEVYRNMRFVSDPDLIPWAEKITNAFKQKLDPAADLSNVKANARFALFEDGHLGKPRMLNPHDAYSWHCELGSGESVDSVSGRESILFAAIKNSGCQLIEPKKRKEPELLVYYFDGRVFPSGALRRIKYIIGDPEELRLEEKPLKKKR